MAALDRLQVDVPDAVRPSGRPSEGALRVQGVQAGDPPQGALRRGDR
ncbi:hypothetical protein [Micromonospora matsumotoense]|nr:hypothetical protein [Micromonospora matsumotoense]